MVSKLLQDLQIVVFVTAAVLEEAKGCCILRDQANLFLSADVKLVLIVPLAVLSWSFPARTRPGMFGGRKSLEGARERNSINRRAKHGPFKFRHKHYVSDPKVWGLVFLFCMFSEAGPFQRRARAHAASGFRFRS